MTTPRRLGKYRLLRRLAVGGTAEVYLATAEGLSGFEKRVVIKRLIPEHARDADVLAMFLDEARLMALLKHPHVAEVYDIGEEDGDYFFALEHVAGPDLREVLRARGKAPLPMDVGLAVIIAVAAGLQHAHEQRDAEGRLLGVVHRDVSPSNVLLGWGGEVKLVDFGVAKWSAQRSRTEQGTLKGKFAYMSPEQCRAEPLDRRSDVFALGVLLYEVTTGCRPFEAESDFEVMSAIVKGTLVPPSRHRPDYPPALEAIAMRALRLSRDERFATAAELGAAVFAHATAERLEIGSARVAAFLGELFPGCAARADQEPQGEEEVERRETAREGGAERTATDWETRRLTEASTTRSARRRLARRALTAGAAIVLLSAGAVGLAVTRRPPPPAVVPAPLPATPTVRAPAPPPERLPANVAPAPPPSSPIPTVAPPAKTRLTGKAPKQARKADASKQQAVWDPDSPVPP